MPLIVFSHLLSLCLAAVDPMADGRILESSGSFLQAAQLYQQVGAEPGPDRAQALVRAGQCYEEAGDRTQALACYNQLLGFDDASYWAEIALARKAELSFQNGDRDGAQSCVTKLEETFPDSPWTVNARITAAKLAGRDARSAEAAYAEELQAFDGYKAALQRSGVDERLQGMEDIIAHHSDTATATRAYESKAHLLWKKGLKKEAIPVWLAVLERAGRTAPKSRIVTRAKMSLGALYRTFGRQQEADLVYESVVSADVGPELAGKAAYCRIAIDFHRMRLDRDAGKPVTDRSSALVARCQALAADEKAGKLERVRAAMLPFEIFSWGGQSEDCIRAAEQFIKEYGGTPYKNEVAMAHFFAASELNSARRISEALPHLQEVVRLTPGQNSLFKTDSIQRAHYQVWRILRKTNAPKEVIDAAAEALLSRFPESGYCQAVRTVQREEARR